MLVFLQKCAELFGSVKVAKLLQSPSRVSGCPQTQGDDDSHAVLRQARRADHCGEGVRVPGVQQVVHGAVDPR